MKDQKNLTKNQPIRENKMIKPQEQIERETQEELLILRELILEGGLIEDYDIPDVSPDTKKTGYPTDLIIY